MAEEAGRLAFDFSFLAVAITTADQPPPLPNTAEPAEVPETVSAAVDNEKDASSLRAENGAVGDNESIDLAKYGSPDALLRLNQIVLPTVMAVVKDSVEHVRSQVAAEIELNRRRGEGKRAHAESGSSVAVGKGKRVATAPAIEQVASAASDRNDTEFFYAPTESHTTPGRADTRCEVKPGKVIVQDNATEDILNTMPKRRDLLKTVLRKISDTGSRRRMIRRSTRALRHHRLGEKLKHAKQVLQHVKTA